MAAGVALELNIDDSQVRRLLELAPTATKLRLRQLVEGAAIDVQREERIQAPVGVHGGSGLRGSIRYEFNANELQAVIAPTVPYAGDVEYGTAPHKVSARPGTSLYQWARFKGINPYAVAYSISRKGTRAHPYIQPTYARMAPKVQRDVEAGIQALTEELNNGLFR